MAFAATIAKNFVLGVLQADSALAGYVGARIYDGPSQQGDPFPLVTLHHLHSRPTLGMGSRRILDNVWLEVRVDTMKTDPTAYAAAQAAAQRIDALLQNAEGVSGVNTVNGMYKDSEYERPNYAGGYNVWMLCQVYEIRITAQPL